MSNTETLPAVAARMREFFPELQGRALAVTEAEITKDNVPSLPLSMVAPLRQTFTQPNGGRRLSVVEEFVIEVWLPPARIKGNSGETPFWSYYEYNEFRNKMFTVFSTWRSPQNGTVAFIGMDVESNYLATALTFRMAATYDVCPSSEEVERCQVTGHKDGEPAQITFSLCQPVSECCPDETRLEQKEKTPCP